MATTKTLTVAQLHKRLQPIFNHYIRLRDTAPVSEFSTVTMITTEGPVEVKRSGTCISCGTHLPYQKLQAGHFIPEQKTVHRYNPKNVNAQCVRCNLYLKGNPFGYMLGLKDKYGAQAVWFLLKTKDDKAVYTVDQLLGMIETYKYKVKELEDGNTATA